MLRGCEVKWGMQGVYESRGRYERFVQDAGGFFQMNERFKY